MSNKIELKLTPSHFEELIKKGYSLDHLFLIKMCEAGYDLTEFSLKGPKYNNLISAILRKGLVSDNKPTKEATELLEFLSSRLTKMPKKKTEDEWFTPWWRAYPATDTFTYKGKKFVGSRALRAGKDDCRAKLYKIITEGEYTIETLIAALEYEVLQKKEKSIKENANKLTFMQNSLTYLNQRSFEPFIELIKETKTVELDKKTSSSVDV